MWVRRETQRLSCDQVDVHILFKPGHYDLLYPGAVSSICALSNECRGATMTWRMHGSLSQNSLRLVSGSFHLVSIPLPKGA